MMDVEKGSLSDEHIVKLSDEISSEDELVKLGVTGLKLKYSKIKTALTNHPQDITSAAHDVLHLWLKRQDDREEAFNNIFEALRACGMNLLAKQLTTWNDERAAKRHGTKRKRATVRRVDQVQASTSEFEDSRGRSGKNDERAAKRHGTKRKRATVRRVDQVQASTSEFEDSRGRSGKVPFDLTDSLINTLGNSISSKDMEQIAVAKLGFEFHQLETLKSEGCTGSKLNKEILLGWRKKGPENTKIELATLLYKAAIDGHGDWRVPHEVLGISKDECYSSVYHT